FHLVLFSSMFRKPIYAIEASNDSRINNFFKGIVETGNVNDIDLIRNKINYDEFHKLIATRRQKSIEWLKNALG
ncbi:MAG: hypothetical protein ACI4A8_02185, partial [Muribaculaceae bacterium]